MPQAPHLPADRPSVEIDLDAACANYRTVAALAARAEAAAVVKCNGYGLGASDIACALAEREGCKSFFVAYAHEGASLRRALSKCAPASVIYVLNGPHNDNLSIFESARLTPVLNSLDQARIWASASHRAPAALHIDTGMNRLGAPLGELDAICRLPLRIELVMSHLACASDPAAPMNERQRAAFESVASLFPGARRSLAASGGAMMGTEYHYDLVRPGIALYGASPFDTPNARLKPVARLTAPVLQLREVRAGETAGYGATRRFERNSRLATIALGYGDGFPRAQGNRGSAVLGRAVCPIVGRVSMDFISLDVTDAPEPIRLGERAEFFGPAYAIEKAAESAGTIAYELLTGLGARLDRRYLSSAPRIGRRVEGPQA
ncbi:MAG: alanine racemase [Alphaproteobacteria bacterium]|nr:alanine racemase [Alphaproteobacteria bacterium]